MTFPKGQKISKANQLELLSSKKMNKIFASFYSIQNFPRILLKIGNDNKYNG